MRQSYDIRATVANMSKSHIRCDRNVIMVEMSYFCRQNVSQIGLEIVANCSHPSEILVLEHYLDGQMKESKKKASICIKNNTSVKKHNQMNENIRT